MKKTGEEKNVRLSIAAVSSMLSQLDDAGMLSDYDVSRIHKWAVEQVVSGMLTKDEAVSVIRAVPVYEVRR